MTILTSCKTVQYFGLSSYSILWLSHYRNTLDRFRLRWIQFLNSSGRPIIFSSYQNWIVRRRYLSVEVSVGGEPVKRNISRYFWYIFEYHLMLCLSVSLAYNRSNWSWIRVSQKLYKIILGISRPGFIILLLVFHINSVKQNLSAVITEQINGNLAIGITDLNGYCVLFSYSSESICVGREICIIS